MSNGSLLYLNPFKETDFQAITSFLPLLLQTHISWEYSQAWWFISVVLAPGRLRQENCQALEVSLKLAYYRLRPCTIKPNTEGKGGTGEEREGSHHHWCLLTDFDISLIGSCLPQDRCQTRSWSRFPILFANKRSFPAYQAQWGDFVHSNHCLKPLMETIEQALPQPEPGCSMSLNSKRA